MRVLIAGEGRNELGGWFDHPGWHQETPRPGVVEALLRRVRPDGWHVVEGVRWAAIRKFRTGQHGDVELRNLRGLFLRARENKVDVVAFVRDRDGDARRESAIEAAIQEEQDLSLVGGVVIERIEDWVLALLPATGGGTRGELASRVEAMSTESMVGVVVAAKLDGLPVDLRRWIDRAQLGLISRPA